MLMRLFRKLKKSVKASTVYKVRVERKTQKKLARISEPYYSQLKSAILNLGQNPRPFGYIKMTGRKAYRLKVAQYRIIYEIKDAGGAVTF